MVFLIKAKMRRSIPMGGAGYCSYVHDSNHVIFAKQALKRHFGAVLGAFWEILAVRNGGNERNSG
jgi:hypothetical protein